MAKGRSLSEFYCWSSNRLARADAPAVRRTFVTRRPVPKRKFSSGCVLRYRFDRSSFVHATVRLPVVGLLLRVERGSRSSLSRGSNHRLPRRSFQRRLAPAAPRGVGVGAQPREMQGAIGLTVEIARWHDAELKHWHGCRSYLLRRSQCAGAPRRPPLKRGVEVENVAGRESTAEPPVTRLGVASFVVRVVLKNLCVLRGRCATRPRRRQCEPCCELRVNFCACSS